MMRLFAFIALALIFLALPEARPCWAAPGQAELIIDGGRVKVYALGDMERPGDLSILRNISPDILAALLPDGRFTSYINAFLISGPGGNVLVDAGLGPKAGGKIMEALKGLNISPGQINQIVLTHLHGDHLGALLDQDGQAVFPSAKLWVNAVEAEYWRQLAKNSSSGSSPQTALLSAYEKQLTLGEIGSPAAPGLTPLAAYGHTPGHTVFLLDLEGDDLLLWGDLMHVAPVQYTHPEAAVTYDVDQDTARQSRLAILAEAADKKWQAAGAHLPFPALVKITKTGETSYAVSPAE